MAVWRPGSRTALKGACCRNGSGPRRCSPNEGKEVIGNVLELSVSKTEAVFRANGLDVLILPLEGLSLNGQFGFRVGKGVNLHAATYSVTLRLAPAPARGR